MQIMSIFYFKNYSPSIKKLKDFMLGFNEMIDISDITVK